MPANRSFPGKKAKQIAGQKERWDHSILSRILVNFSTTLLEQINHEKKGKKSSRLHRFHWPLARCHVLGVPTSKTTQPFAPAAHHLASVKAIILHIAYTALVRICTPIACIYHSHITFFFWYERKETLQSTRKKKNYTHTHTLLIPPWIPQLRKRCHPTVKNR
jgi:hypothetical protein